MNRSLKALAFAAVSALITTAAQAGERGYFGVSFSIDSEGFFLNPTLKSVRLDRIAANSPAAKAGLEPGDLVLEIEGKKIAGTKALEFKPYMDREPGQVLHLAVKKRSGEVRRVVVTAGRK